MSENDTKERIRAVEVKVSGLARNFERFEKQTLESFAAIGERIDKFMNDDIHDLQDQIDELKSRSLTRSDWAKIFVTVIITAGAVVMAYIKVFV